ncbi:MAG: metallophosphoesterase [Actinomycetes bacterium]
MNGIRLRRLAVLVAMAAIVPALWVEGPDAATAVEPTPVPITTIAAVGDLACDSDNTSFKNGLGTSTKCQQMQVSNVMVADTSVTDVLGLGDFQYYCDDAADFEVSYTPSWGRVNDLMTPVAGNHEYTGGHDPYGKECPAGNSTAQTYFNYFGAAAHPETVGHFSFDLGNWHLVGLNAQCSRKNVGGCGATAAQTKWLEADLAASTQPCTLAFWHQPLFTGAGGGKTTAYQPWWNSLYAAGADVVLNGHRHNYQRFGSLNPSGARDADNGITQYVAGTGGESLQSFSSTAFPQPEYKLKGYGYLRLDLEENGWSSDFVTSTGSAVDNFSGTCH